MSTVDPVKSFVDVAMSNMAEQLFFGSSIKKVDVDYDKMTKKQLIEAIKKFEENNISLKKDVRDISGVRANLNSELMRLKNRNRFLRKALRKGISVQDNLIEAIGVME